MKKWRSILTFRVLGTAFSLAFVLGCLALIYRDEIDEGRIALNKRWEKYQTDRVEASIRGIRAELAEVDEVIVLRLDDRMPSVDLGSMAIEHSEDERLFVVKKVTLTGAEAVELARKWCDLTIYPKSYAGCHWPHHALQFRSKGREISQVVVCFMCGNATIPSLFGSDLVGIDGYDVGKSALQTFQMAVESRVGAYEKPKR